VLSTIPHFLRGWYRFAASESLAFDPIKGAQASGAIVRRSNCCDARVIMPVTEASIPDHLECQASGGTEPNASSAPAAFAHRLDRGRV